MILLLLPLLTLKKILKKKLENLRKKRTTTNLIKIKTNERKCRNLEKKVFSSTS
jgi:hypothetical protein